jgi:acetolactate synthase-1/2/3 large subunit
MNHVSFPSAHAQNLNGDPRVLGEADVVLAIDVLDVPDLVGLYGDEEGRRPAKGSEVAVIDLSLNDFAFRSWSHVGGEISPADIRLLADPIAGMGQLIEALTARAQDRAVAARIQSRAAEIGARHRALRARQQEEAAVRAKAANVSRPRLVDMVWEAVRGRDCVLSGRSLKGWPEGVWDFKGVGEFLGANIGGGIGYGPGAAVGAALATHEQGKFPVVILGDGDMVMAAGALWTAVHYKIPLLAIIDNNRSFMNDEEHQRKMARHRERSLENAWIGTAMFDPEVDFATVSRGFGAWAKGPIESARELAPALREAVAEVEKGGVAVIDVRTVRPW